MRDKTKQGKNPGVSSEQCSDVKYFTPESQSRRDFLEGTGATVVAGAAVTALGIPAAPIEANRAVITMVNWPAMPRSIPRTWLIKRTPAHS